ncbi:hypothetical protein GCM10017786_50050 [Amycolatopsis deserti]|uniref:Uncharacterized protein n=1 Tax=Amycolatopsis deserti TaxID=185696 RepID=A0ABQ3JAH0_9PSEU|nr:hypothetical protein [Amycolatopsis deserti]GHF10368.1 hypothetical protein GCM10017786_50050 [Amycolatopsis deserti]
MEEVSAASNPQPGAGDAASTCTRWLLRLFVLVGLLAGAWIVASAQADAAGATHPVRVLSADRGDDAAPDGNVPDTGRPTLDVPALTGSARHLTPGLESLVARTPRTSPPDESLEPPVHPLPTAVTVTEAARGALQNAGEVTAAAVDPALGLQVDARATARPASAVVRGLLRPVTAAPAPARAAPADRAGLAAGTTARAGAVRLGPPPGRPSLPSHLRDAGGRASAAGAHAIGGSPPAADSPRGPGPAPLLAAKGTPVSAQPGGGGAGIAAALSPGPRAVSPFAPRAWLTGRGAAHVRAWPERPLFSPD